MRHATSQHHRRLLSLAFAVAAAWPLGAGAGDGALEIGHVCAAGPGCFPGDSPGYPVEILAPGSDRLTSVGPGSVVTASAVTLIDGAGPSALIGSQIVDCVASGHDGFGLVLGPASGCAGNVMTLNGGGTISGGTQTGANARDGVVCP